MLYIWCVDDNSNNNSNVGSDINSNIYVVLICYISFFI